MQKDPFWSAKGVLLKNNRRVGRPRPTHSAFIYSRLSGYNRDAIPSYLQSSFYSFYFLHILFMFSWVLLIVLERILIECVQHCRQIAFARVGQ